MRRVMGAVLAAAVLVAAGFTLAAITGGTAVAQEQDAPTATEAPPAPGTVLAEVLDGLVADGVITEAQAERITDALAVKRDEIREQYPNLGHRGFRRGFRLGSWLADGVIDADELAELPDDHPLVDPQGPAAPYLEDGQITQEELEHMRQERHEQRRAAHSDA